MEQPKFYSLDFEDENKAMPPDSVLAVYRYFRIATLVLMGIGFIPLVPTLLLLWTFFSEGLGFTQILTGESVRDLRYYSRTR